MAKTIIEHDLGEYRYSSDLEFHLLMLGVLQPCHGGHIKLVREGGEQPFLGYLSQGRLEFTLYFLRPTVPGEQVEEQSYRIRLAR